MISYIKYPIYNTYSKFITNSIIANYTAYLSIDTQQTQTVKKNYIFLILILLKYIYIYYVASY